MRRSKVLLGLCVLTLAAVGESNAGIITYLRGQGYTDIADPNVFEFGSGGIQPGDDISSDDLPAALKGYVHYDTGLHATENWADSNTTLFWDITPGNQYMNYRYTFYVAESYNQSHNTKDISHMIFQVSDDFGFDNVMGDMDFYYGEYDDIPNKDDQRYYDDVSKLTKDTLDENNEDHVEIGIYDALGSNVDGLKIGREQDDDKIWTVEFQSNRVAMWGNFYAKDGANGGSPILAYNTELHDSPGVLIPVPNGETYTPLPEPASLMIWSLLGASIVGITAMRRRKQSRSA